MIRIHLDDATVARTRLAVSPLWEIQTGFWMLCRNPGELPWPYTEWARQARRVLAGLPASAPIRVYLDAGADLPDFLSPLPPTAAPSLDEELTALRETPEELVAEQLRRHWPDGGPAWLRPYATDPRGTLDRVADELLAWWDATLAPWWPAMRAALDEEVLHRARSLAADGPDALLADLHVMARWERPVLTVAKSWEQEVHAVDRRLLLVPLIFSGTGLGLYTDHPGVLAVSYPARGAGVLAGGSADAPGAGSDRLALLLGRGRATVLRALVRPATTAGLAGALGLAPSTVSEHLSALLAAGVVHRRRVGRRVLYGLEPAGTALLGLLSGEQVRTTA
ncbi:ArsR family transcriptional regulator [Micromonospora coxensis]|uniref:DNA-binding transcriptional regulator, ArsR family n=1 Tax=Micromonospora coxensis TaxID=356852 RepID=A0A1C5HXT4_9ACTN|nr:ArsR family transcriptional regulator [Micromonospora coxensis]SCG50864.1 DNA-binding transcriptional regulator, ArsR family [Micromonospora coxensis]